MAAPRSDQKTEHQDNQGGLLRRLKDHPTIAVLGAIVMILGIAQVSISAKDWIEATIVEAAKEAASTEGIAKNLVEDPQFVKNVIDAISEDPQLMSRLKGPPGERGLVGPAGPMGPPGPQGKTGPKGEAVSIRNDSCNKICASRGKTCKQASYVVGGQWNFAPISCDTPINPNEKYACECN